MTYDWTSPQNLREHERPFQVTDQGEVHVGLPGELHAELEQRLGKPAHYVPSVEGVVHQGEVKPFYGGKEMLLPEWEHEILRQAAEPDPRYSNDFQPLNDASPFDFSRPGEVGGDFDNQRPFLVHQTDEGHPEVLLGGFGDLHNDLRDRYDVGHELLRGYTADDGHLQVETGDEGYLPLVEKHIESMEDDPYSTVHEAALTDKAWAYLNGEVGFGDHHHQIVDTLAERQKLPEMQRGLLSNLALANAHPGDLPHDIAWGRFHQGYPVFWRTNVDRNHIWDAVQNARHVVEPPSPVTAGLKVMSEIDFIKTTMTDSASHLVEIQPGGIHMNYDGQPTQLPEPSSSSTPQLERRQNYYGANVEKDGNIIGSVSVEVEANTRRNGEHWQEVVLHDAWVDPQYRGTNVWLQLYQWLRQHWPHDRIFGEFANQDLGEFFERDNRRRYLGDDSAWEQTGIGDAGPPPDGQPEFAPQVYASTADEERELVRPTPGVGYLSADGNDVTNHVRASGSLHIDNDGKPVLTVSREMAEPPGRAHGTLTRVNAFRKGDDWRWAEPHEQSTIVSVEHGPSHHYALHVDMNSPVHLRQYDEEPTLRPTTRGDLDFGDPVGNIRIRGRVHPVFDKITVDPRRATEHVGIALNPHFQKRAPWYIDMQGNPVIGDWGQFHHEIGGQGSANQAKGEVNQDGEVTVYRHAGWEDEHPQQVLEQVAPHMRRAFGLGFHPVLKPTHPADKQELDFTQTAPAPVAPEPLQADPNGLRARLKGLASAWHRVTGEGDTELPGRYHMAAPQPGEVGYDIMNSTGMAHKLEDGTWASWSGWPDAYRFLSDGQNYMEQPESSLESGHGFGHPGLKETWRQVWPDLPVPNPALEGHSAGWHIPTPDGHRGILAYVPVHRRASLLDSGLPSHIEHQHGAPARLLDLQEPFDPKRSLMQPGVPQGNMIWKTDEPSPLTSSPQSDTVNRAADLDFSAPAPIPGGKLSE